MAKKKGFVFESNAQVHIDQIIKGQIKGLIASGFAAEGIAVKLAPVDTGNMRQGIRHDVDEKELFVVVGAIADYAPYVELGTSKQRPQPFIRPALSNKKLYRNIISEAIRKEVEG